MTQEEEIKALQESLEKAEGKISNLQAGQMTEEVKFFLNEKGIVRTEAQEREIIEDVFNTDGSFGNTLNELPSKIKKRAGEKLT